MRGTRIHCIGIGIGEQLEEEETKYWQQQQYQPSLSLSGLQRIRLERLSALSLSRVDWQLARECT